MFKKQQNENIDNNDSTKNDNDQVENNTTENNNDQVEHNATENNNDTNNLDKDTKINEDVINENKNNAEDINLEDMETIIEEQDDSKSSQNDLDVNVNINELKTSNQQLKEQNQKLLYTISEQNNQMQALMKKHSQELEKTYIRIIEKLTPVIDNILLLYKYKDSDPNNLKFPIDLVKKELDTLLSKTNTTIINPEKDTLINSKEHEIISSTGEANTKIKSVQQCGLKYKDIVLRPAKIISY